MHITTENRQTTKEDSHRRNKVFTKQPENNYLNGSCKSLSINNYLECKKIKLFNKKTQSDWIETNKGNKSQ